MRCYTNLNPMQVLYSYPIKFYYSHPIKISTHVFYSSTQVFYSFRKMSLKQWAQNQKKSIVSEKLVQKVNSTKTSQNSVALCFTITKMIFISFSFYSFFVFFHHRNFPSLHYRLPKNVQVFFSTRALTNSNFPFFIYLVMISSILWIVFFCDSLIFLYISKVDSFLIFFGI